MKTKVLILVVFSLLVCSIGLTAKERRGAELVVQKKDGQTVKGELIAAKPSSLLLLDSQTGADVSVEIGKVAVIKIIKKSKALIIGAIGLGLGVLSGIALAESAQSAETDPWGDVFFATMFGGPVYNAIGGGIVLGISGALIGALVGKDKTIQLERKSDSEISEILEKLRRQARVPNVR